MAAEQTLAAGPDVFPNIRIVMGMVIGLGVARLLSGVARTMSAGRRYLRPPTEGGVDDGTNGTDADGTPS